MAKQRRLKCTKCDRKFSMAAHLARHMSTLHASRKIKAAKRASVAARVERGVGSGLGGVLDSLEAYQDRLAAQRHEIDNRIQAIGAALAALGAGTKPVVARRGRGKRPRGGSLKEHIARVLRGLVRGHSVGDIATAVKKAGYKSKDKRFNHTISKTLSGMKDVARVGHGVYRLK